MPDITVNRKTGEIEIEGDCGAQWGGSCSKIKVTKDTITLECDTELVEECEDMKEKNNPDGETPSTDQELLDIIVNVALGGIGYTHDEYIAKEAVQALRQQEIPAIIEFEKGKFNIKRLYDVVSNPEDYAQQWAGKPSKFYFPFGGDIHRPGGPFYFNVMYDAYKGIRVCIVDYLCSFTEDSIGRTYVFYEEKKDYWARAPKEVYQIHSPDMIPIIWKTNNPGNPKKKLTVLTDKEEVAWNFAWEYYVNEGYEDNEAAELAWKDLQIEFPRLKEYDGIKSDTNNPGKPGPQITTEKELKNHIRLSPKDYIHTMQWQVYHQENTKLTPERLKEALEEDTHGFVEYDLCARLLNKYQARYMIEYFDPKDPKAERTEIWYFDDYNNAVDQQEELMVAWQATKEEIKIVDLLKGSNPGNPGPACPPGQEETDGFCAQRLEDPKHFDKRSFRTMCPKCPGGECDRCEELGIDLDDTTHLVIGCPKGEYDPKSDVCKTSTRGQTILRPK